MLSCATQVPLQEQRTLLLPLQMLQCYQNIQQPALRRWPWLKKTPRPRPCFFPEVAHSQRLTNTGGQRPSPLAPTWDNLMKDHPSSEDPGGAG